MVFLFRSKNYKDLMIRLADFIRDYFINESLKNEDRFIVEGLDISTEDFTIRLTMDHDKGVDFSKVNNPVYGELDNGQKTISIFRRTELKEPDFDKPLDGNPFIYALKEKKGWKIEMTNQEIKQYLRRFIDICSELKDKKFDTIICIPSSSKLNKRFCKAIASILGIKVKIEDMFSKIPANEVYFDYIDREQIKKDEAEGLVDFHEVMKSIRTSLRKMKGKDFEAKNFPKKYLKYVKYIDNDDEPMKYRPDIDGKNVVLIDDIISSGSTVESCCDAILAGFIPKSLTVVTLLSKLEKDKKVD